MTPSIENAITQARAGNLAAAESICLTILEQEPAHAEALHLKGVLCSMAGRFSEAETLLRQAIAIQDNIAKYHNNLGNACKAQGKLDEGIVSYQRATELDGGFVDAWYNLGVALADKGELEKSLAAYQKVLSLAPLAVEALNNQGLVQMRLGRFSEAAASFRRATEINDREAGIWYNLGSALKAVQEMDGALDAYLRATNIRPGYVEALLEAADIHSLRNNATEGIRLYEQALQTAPDNLRALAGSAWLYESMNNLGKLEPLLARGLELDRQHPMLNLVRAKQLRRVGKEAEAASTLESLDLAPASREVAIAVQHELGLLHDRLMEPDKAFACFSTAKTLQAQIAEETGVDKSSYLVQLERNEKGFRESAPLDWKALELTPLNNSLTFIVGFPRSGTTLLDQVLDSHPQVRTMEERPLLAMLRENIDADPQRAFHALAHLSSTQANELREQYMKAAQEEVSLFPGAMLVDKFPLNITRIPLIHRLFPEARIILALRHPCDVCLSCFMQLFGVNEAMANFFTFPDAARMYGQVMKLWKLYEETLPLNYHRIRYEDVVQDFRGEISRLLDYLGLPWNDKVEKFYEHAQQRGKINTPSYHQVSEPIYSRAAYRWERYRKFIEPDLPVLAPFIEYFGYES